jgi:hypothetical protein
MELVNRALPKVPRVAQLNVMGGLVLAMSVHQLGDRSAARSEVERCKTLIETGFNLDVDMWHWREWVFTRLLLREAEGLLQQLPLEAPKQ